VEASLLGLAEIAAFFLRGAVGGRLEVVSEGEAAGIPVL